MARRIVAILACLLLAQLTLAASGLACVAHGGDHGVQADLRHAAHLVPDAVADGASPHCAPEGQAPAGQHDCGAPWAQGGCAAMAACAPAIVPVVAALDGVALPSQRVAWLDALAPPSPIAIPEAPPPRA